MDLSPGARGLIRHGVLLLLVAGVAVVWELLASQPPSSPYRVGVFAEPVTDLKHAAVMFAVLCFSAAWLRPWLGAGTLPRLVLGAIHVGVLITTLSLIYGATTGMKGVQFDDPRPDSMGLLAFRLLGEAIVGLGLLGFASRILLREPPTS